MGSEMIDFRNALGRFATGVCVITAISEQGEPFGMTVNSFASVSLEPQLILWSLQNNSECFPAFEGSPRYAVNVLADSQLEISNFYAKKGDHLMPFEHYTYGKTGIPVLKGALAVFECETWRTYDGGDHLILVGEVVAFAANESGNPLLFFSGKYNEIKTPG